MDGYFLRDEEIIGAGSENYKPFDLGDWKVSPTTDFPLEPPEFNFTTENLIDRVVKEESNFGDSESWFCVLNPKESWSETKTKSLAEGYLNEQVVPDQNQTMDIVDRKNKSVSVEQIPSEFAENMEDSYTKINKCSETEHTTNDIIGNRPDENLSKESSIDSLMFIVDHKEQVRSEQGRFEIPPANVLFTSDSICKEKSIEKEAKSNIRREIPKDLIEETIQESSGLVCKKENPKTRSSTQSTSGYVGPVLKTNHEIRLVEQNIKQKNNEINSNENEILKIRTKLIKLLTTDKIPKCTMVKYKFESNKLPSFAETFCPDFFEERERHDRDIELPEVLLSHIEDLKERDKEMFTILPESDSEGESGELTQDDKLGQHKEPDSSEPCGSSDELKLNIKSEVMETETQILNNSCHKTQNGDTPSSMLAIDDELEKYLVSSIVLNETTHDNFSQLPDLSNNIISLLRCEGLNDENMESVYGNLFSKPELQVDGMRSCKQEQNTNIELAESSNNFERNVLDTTSPRQWQISQDNTNTLYGNIWCRNTATEGFAGNSRHFPNSMSHMKDPFINSKELKSILPAELMQTDIDPFKLNNLVPKVEVVDSSLNYGF